MMEFQGYGCSPLMGRRKKERSGFLRASARVLGDLRLNLSPVSSLSKIDMGHHGIDHHCLGTWGLIGYTFEGVNKEMQKLFGSNAGAHIITSRKARGFEEFRNATSEEKAMVIERWRSVGTAN
jgi:hypothetical protein